MKVVARKEESLDELLARFKKKMENEGVIREWKEKQFFEKPSIIRHRHNRLVRRKMLLEKNKK